MTPRRRPAWQVGVVLGLGVILMLGLVALGWWQMERRAWKHDLIARVEARIHTAPLPLAALDGLAPDEKEYRRVTVSGRFIPTREVLVRAVTGLGGGYWVLTPLITGDGRTVLINRGFVPPELRNPQTRGKPPAGPVTITGLARLSEPGGAFLRDNDPQADRWYSRDIDAMASALGLDGVASVFVDAGVGPSDTYPVGGLTVVQFRDTHLVYALTWFALAVMVAAGLFLLIRYEMHPQGPGLRKPQQPAPPDNDLRNGRFPEYH